MAEMKRYRVGSLVFWYDPNDPLLPKNAELLDVPKKPKPKAKAAKPANKAVKAENK